MKYLQALNWILLALGLTMFVNLAVVCLLYLVYLDQAPRYTSEFRTALVTTSLFLAIALSSAAAAFGHRGQRAWRWPAEVLVVASVGAVVWYYLPR